MKKRASVPRTKPTRRKRVVMARVIKLGEDDGSFDDEFWRRVGPEGRQEAMWQLVLRYWQMKGRDPRELRLDRSVVVVKRRKGKVSHRRRARGQPPR